jgi:hypothetical protein
LELSIFELLKLLIHSIEFLLLGLKSGIYLNGRFFLFVSNLVQLVEVFPLNPGFLLDLAHLLVHDNVARPLGVVLLIKHLDLVHVGHLEVFGLGLPNSRVVIDVEFTFDALVTRHFETQVPLLQMQDHRYHLYEIVVHVLVWLDLFYYLLTCYFFGHHLCRYHVFDVLWLLLQFVDLVH